MAWKTNKRLVSDGFPDLKYLPKERAGWDATLSCLAYGVRMDIERARPDLGAWAARHCLPASRRSAEFGEDALVLWHGTSRERAEKIAEHGLFHKKGLWTARHPAIPHGFCRTRSERFGTEGAAVTPGGLRPARTGAVVCLVLDRRELVEGRDFEAENDNVVRFMHRLPPEVVEYVLVHEGISFTGKGRARRPSPWQGARFKRGRGGWVPVRKAPVRYTGEAAYSTAAEFARVCVARLLAGLGEITALEVFSSIYAAIDPRDALTHRDILEAIEETCVPFRRRAKCRTFRAKA